ncbi:hypothetical protein TVAG_490040 [Trichomonas vaginalis G3]|uniref:Uncharacterized protein n=1 Tax=Trichomonas vaginalis (strain ATCC PRA-98 / G3) TaxID=412133 RepID=A2FB41_TRIV3|nr:Ankyrin repeat family [Trichomonas vaginalis G3]EAX97876.1 hypothetical protein TVAG_490040 [Trichomonas vaginalis G3]KAI5501155.1 Ankyrin repeat family [Trichomonas vaginalis G3]|eukprot:XP_001310806.1 hypothetical protein [Trichomonas vaginalis G3]
MAAQDQYNMTELLTKGIEIQDAIYDVSGATLESCINFIKSIDQKYNDDIIRTIYHAAKVRPNKFRLLEQLISIYPDYPINYNRFGLYLLKKKNMNTFGSRTMTRTLFRRECYADLDKTADQIADIFEEGSVPYALINDDHEFFIQESSDFSLSSQAYDYDLKSYNLISLAAMFGAENCFTFLVLNGVTVDTSCISYIIQGGNLNLVERYVTDFSNFSEDYVRIAIEYHQNSIAKWILENKPEISVSLGFCVKERNIEMFYHFLSEGGDIHERDHIDGTIFTRSSFYGIYSIVEFLLKNNADIEEKNDFQHTAVFQAAIQDNLDIFMLLIQHGANYEGTDSEGKTPVKVAIEKGSTKVVKYLMQLKASQ